MTTTDQSIKASMYAILTEQHPPFALTEAPKPPSVTLTVAQLREALLVMGDKDPETELSFMRREEGVDTDGERAPAGMYCWITDYAEEGSILLDGGALPPVEMVDVGHISMANLEAIGNSVHDLIYEAKQAGCLVTLGLKPLTPLAMGNHRYQIELRPILAHVRAAHEASLLLKNAL